jgi:photosystem II stability/assembly factor-like uncharacterized protein
MAVLRRMLGGVSILCLFVQAAYAGHDTNNVLSVVVDPQSPETLYAATDAGVLKSTDGGATWASAGLTTTHVWGIAVDPQLPSTLYAWSYDTAGLYKSIDGGASWQAVPSLESTYVVAFAIDPSASNTLYDIQMVAPTGPEPFGKRKIAGEIRVG